MAVKRWNGTSWDIYAGSDPLSGIPSQTGNSGKYLKTDGSIVSWATVPVTSAATSSELGTVYGLTNSTNATKYGYLAAPNSSGGTSVLAIGYQSGVGLTTGSSNVLVGTNSGMSITDGSQNTIIGSSTASNGNYSSNTVVGIGSLQNTTGSYNTAVGAFANTYLSTGQNNTLLGASVSPTLRTGSNNIVIGYDADVTTSSISNQITLGNANISNFRIPGLGVNWSTSAYGRATYASTSAPSGGNDGDVWLVYTA